MKAFLTAQAIAERRMFAMTDSQLESQWRHELRMAGDNMTPGLAAAESLMIERGLICGDITTALAW